MTRTLSRFAVVIILIVVWVLISNVGMPQVCSRHVEEGAGASYALHRFRVHLQADQFDNDSHRYYVEVWATDPEDARRQVWRTDPRAGIRRVEVVA